MFVRQMQNLSPGRSLVLYHAQQDSDQTVKCETSLDFLLVMVSNVLSRNIVCSYNKVWSNNVAVLLFYTQIDSL